MAVVTLLDILKSRYGVAADPDSTGGQILHSLSPDGNFTDGALRGQASFAPLTLAPTAGGVRVQAAGAGDMLVLGMPLGPVDFEIVPPAGGQPDYLVQITLVALQAPAPFLRPASVNDQASLIEGSGQVLFDFPDLLLVVTASTAVAASARLAPSHDAAGHLEIAMVPPVALLGPGTVLGFAFDRAILDLDAPAINVPMLDVYVAPEGIPPLAMKGGVSGLVIGLGSANGGITGTFSLSLATGAVAPLRPRFLRNMAAQLKLQRSTVTLLQLTGEVDIAGEVAARAGTAVPGVAGIIAYTLRLVLDGGWRASLDLAAANGSDFLWRTGSPDQPASDIVRDTLGAYAVFSPLLTPALPGAGQSGYVDLALSTALAAALAGSSWIGTRSITLFGGELSVAKPAIGDTKAFLFADIETVLDLSVAFGGTPIISTHRPLKVRQKAVGFQLDFGGGSVPALKPVFDPAQGFSLDLSDPGTFDIPGPLGDVLQPDRARMARENPVNFEVDLILKADLGVVTIDRASVRVPLTGGGGPTLRGLGARLDAGPMQGGGYLNISENGIAGGLDASLAPPLGLRASADLNLGKAHDDGTGEDLTSVLAAFSVELPVPIPFANSGLGLFGFLGLFGMNIERDEGAGGALQWLIDANGDAARGVWRGAAHRWALGLGAVIGTVEGGFLVHAKGMLMLELPGPRILVMMKADILSKRPPKEGGDLGTLLAIIDIRPQSLTIGVVAEYTIPFLLEVRVPAEAFFDFTRAENWHLDIGRIPPRLPASVRFMQTLRADGYLMIHGDGISDFPLRKLQGFSVAAGIRAALTWGPKAIGLYIRVAAHADVAISFKPASIIGKMTLEGELHLFIVSIGASATAELRITEPDRFFVRAQVCGKVDFFFFDVEGCVTLKFGDETVVPPDADPLIRALTLHSRSPALLPGSGADQAVDSSLGTAFFLNGQNEFVGDSPDVVMPVVPIDAIPVLQFEMRPHAADDCAFFDARVPSLLSDTDWVRRGERFYRYTLNRVELLRIDEDGTPIDGAVQDGETPVVWWDRHGGGRTAGDDSDVQLALLNWIPDPAPAAAERTATRDSEITRRWGHVCEEVAGPAPVLWTFRDTFPGPSPKAWTIKGTALPDAEQTTRSAPPPDLIRISEPWRSGNALADSLVAVEPAYVLASPLTPERVLMAPRADAKLPPRISGDGDFDKLLNQLPVGRHEILTDALQFGTFGVRRFRALIFGQDRKDLLELRDIDRHGDPTGFSVKIEDSNSHFVGGMGDLPDEWQIGDVENVVDAWFGIFSGPLREPWLRFVEIECDANPARVELGYENASPIIGPRWGALLVEAISDAEFRRSDFDRVRRQDRINVVDGALGADQSTRALLVKDALYELAIGYDVSATGADAAGNAVETGVVPQSKSQRFRFRTEAYPPARLESWVLTSAPAEGEAGFFCADPLRVIFSTNATRGLFAAYGYGLSARVRAASAKHPQASQGFDPADVALDAASIPPAGLAAAAVTPFEGALRDAVQGQSCIDTSHRRNRHEMVTLTMRLEPSTEYILDIQALAQPGAPPLPATPYPMFRRNFTTSRYTDIASFAGDVRSRPAHHRSLSAITPFTALAGKAISGVVTETDLQDALRAVRWGEIGQDRTPRVTVIWQAGSPSQPFAILVETTEPPWRSRGVPELVPSPQGVQQYRLVDKVWLDLVERNPAPARVLRFLRSAGGSRTLVMLAPGARGARIQLSLRRTALPLFDAAPGPPPALFADILLVAPWETPS